jgi:multidrug efflux system membrane fusion protein
MIRFLKRRRGVIIALIVILAVIGGIVMLVKARTAQKAAKAVTPDTTIPVNIGHAAIADVPLTVDGIGTVQALNTVNIRPMIDGPLIEIDFHEGQDVRAGDVLARIDSRIYKANYDQAVAKKAQDEATLENARRDLGRYDKLAKTQYTTAQQADTQRATVAQDEAIVRQDQAQIDSARTNLAYCTITAPVDGRVGIRQVDVGNLVHSTDATPLTVLTTLRPISVVFTLPQQNLADVTTAIEAARAQGGAEVEALPQDGGGGDNSDTAAVTAKVLDRGRVGILDNEVDSNTGTIKLKATFPNPALRLWPGAFVNVRMSLRVDRGVVTVPVAAVQRGPQGAFVYTLDQKVGDKSVAHRHPVVVRRQDEQVAIIASGLNAGEAVVTDGASRLTEGSKVRLQAPGT